MLARILRIIGSLAVVIAAYTAYSLFAVPWIEPQAVRHETTATSDEERAKAAGVVNAQRAGLTAWFAGDDWELTSPKILETSQGKLLLRDYERLSDPRFVKMEPCSIVFMPEGEFDSEEERNRRAIVLRAPKGATLEFDRPFNLERGEFSKLEIVGAKLKGEVTIHSQQRSPGPEDDLSIVTRDVTYGDNQISTPEVVKFRLGENHGEGRQLRIDLATPAERNNPAGQKFGSVKRFELARDVRLRVYPGESDLFPSGPSAPRAASKKPQQQAPVEITCAGPFQFDLLAYVATFNDHVDVLRLNPNAASDQLTCDKLDLYFESDTKASASGESPKSPKLHPSRLTARGNPVVLNSPSNGIQARGQRLEYDVQNKNGKLFDKNDAFLREESKLGQPPQEIHARELEFESDPNNPSGPPRKLIAKGQGWLVANASEDRTGAPAKTSQQLKAKWSHSLTFAPYTEPFSPHQEYRLLSLRGASHVELPGSGAMDAEEIHVYLKELPDATATAGAPARNKLVPAKLNALGAMLGAVLRPKARPGRGGGPPTIAKDYQHCVRIFSPQLDGVVNEIRVWFQQPAPAPVAAAPANASAPAVTPAPPPEPASKQAAADPQQHFHVSGDVLQVNALLAGDRGGAAQITDVILNGEMHCKETRTARPDELPLEITGEQLHLVQHQPENAIVTVTGQPARVDARGMRLEGGTASERGEIHLHRGQNKLWIDGPGFLSLPADRDLQGRARPKSANERLKIWWLGRMDFDGIAAEFKDRVTVVHAASKLLTPLLHVDFDQRVQFGAGNAGEQPEVKQVFCRQGVEMLNQSFDPTGRLASRERLLAQDLNYVYATGDIEAQGPGEVSRVWIDTGESVPGLPGAKKKEKPVAARNAPPGLLFLKVKFDRHLEGNQHRQVMHFHNQVRSVYGPVLAWEAQLDPERPGLLDERGFVLTCTRRLTIAQIDSQRSASSAFELQAEGNAVVENSQYTARASYLKYERSKDLLTLDGDGYSKAKLFRQPRAGGDRSVLESRSIWFRPSTNDAKLDGFMSLDFTDLTRAKSDERK